MFKVNKKGACLVLGVCGSTTVINACSNKDAKWDKEGISNWLKDKVKLKDEKVKDENNKALGDIAENISKNENIDETKLNAFKALYKAANKIDTWILEGDKKLIDAGNNPDKKKYAGKKAYHITGEKDNEIDIATEDFPKAS